MFPFFTVDLAGGWTNEVTFGDDGSVAVTSTCKAGNPQILGALVTPIDQAVAFVEVAERELAAA